MNLAFGAEAATGQYSSASAFEQCSHGSWGPGRLADLNFHIDDEMEDISMPDNGADAADLLRNPKKVADEVVNELLKIPELCPGDVVDMVPE